MTKYIKKNGGDVQWIITRGETMELVTAFAFIVLLAIVAIKQKNQKKTPFITIGVFPNTIYKIY